MVHVFQLLFTAGLVAAWLFLYGVAGAAISAVAEPVAAKEVFRKSFRS